MICTSCQTAHPQTYVGLNRIECHGNARCVHYVGAKVEEDVTMDALLAIGIASSVTDHDRYDTARAKDLILCTPQEGRRRAMANLIAKGACTEKAADIATRLREGREARERYEAAKLRSLLDNDADRIVRTWGYIDRVTRSPIATALADSTPNGDGTHAVPVRIGPLNDEDKARVVSELKQVARGPIGAVEDPEAWRDTVIGTVIRADSHGFLFETATGLRVDRLHWQWTDKALPRVGDAIAWNGIGQQYGLARTKPEPKKPRLGPVIGTLVSIDDGFAGVRRETRFGPITTAYPTDVTGYYARGRPVCIDLDTGKVVLAPEGHE